MDPLRAVKDNLQQADVFGKHLLEHVADPLGVLPGDGKDDGLAGQVSAAVLDANLHDLFPLSAERILVADEHFQVGAGVIEPVGVEAW